MNPIDPTAFEAALAAWLAAFRARVAEHYAAHYPTLAAPTIEIERGRRYLRVIKDGGLGGRSACGFIDATNGDVLKSASWKGPAKGRRGNLFDAQGGLARVHTYGVH